MGFPWVSRCASEAHSDELPVSIWWYCNWCRSRIVCRRGPSPLLQRPLRSAVAQFFCDQNCTELLVSSHFHAWLCKSCHELPILHRYATHLRHSASPIAICNTAIRLLDLQSAIADALHNLTCPCGMHHHENERQEILPLFIDIIITLIVSSSRQEVVEGKDAVEEIRDQTQASPKCAFCKGRRKRKEWQPTMDTQHRTEKCSRTNE